MVTFTLGRSKLQNMEIHLTPEQSDFVRHAIETGRLHDPVQAVQEAMTLWVERERRRTELLASLDAAEVSLVRGEGMAITQDSMVNLVHDVMQRNRNRFPPEPSAGR
jgi:Arc/MetJ-type ribon-helix-helix transcriptional regulator